MKAKRITAIFICIMLLCTSVVYAASVITKEYDFQTSDPNYESYTIDNIGKGDMKDIPVTVENGFFTVKRVTDIKIKLISEEIPEEAIYEDLLSKKLPEEADKYESEDGKMLDLVDKYEEEIIYNYYSYFWNCIRSDIKIIYS